MRFANQNKKKSTRSRTVDTISASAYADKTTAMMSEDEQPRFSKDDIKYFAKNDFLAGINYAFETYNLR